MTVSSPIFGRAVIGQSHCRSTNNSTGSNSEHPVHQSQGQGRYSELGKYTLSPMCTLFLLCEAQCYRSLTFVSLRDKIACDSNSSRIQCEYICIDEIESKGNLLVFSEDGVQRLAGLHNCPIHRGFHCPCDYRHESNLPMSLICGFPSAIDFT